jgi:ATP-dependent helicase/DNAse subunit B
MSENLRLSVSKVKTFLQCNKKYHFSYVLKLPQKERDYHTFGKFCHKVLEDFHLALMNDSKLPFNKEMDLAFKTAAKEYQDKMTPEMKKECWEIINQYLKKYTQEHKENRAANVIACEKNFELVIENVVLNGMIDRIQVDPDGVIHVADYKTSKSKKYLKDDWFQLLTYCFVILSDNPDLEKIRASYIMMRHDFEYITKEFTIEQILKIKDQYIEYAQKIVNEKDFPPNPTILCGYCDFVDMCSEGKQKISPSKTFGEVKW